MNTMGPMRGESAMVALAALASVAFAGCASETSVADYDFIGVVEEMDLDDWNVFPSSNPPSPGGEESLLEVGPGRLVLHDRTVLEVPEATPGGNTCPALASPRSEHVGSGAQNDTRCVLMGSFSDGGPPEVAWFLVLTEEPVYWDQPDRSAGEADRERRRVVQLRNPRVDGDGLAVEMAGRWYRFPVSRDAVELDCRAGHVVSAGENADSRPDTMPRGYLDAESGMVIALRCLDSARA